MKAIHSNLRQTCRLLLTSCMMLCLTQAAFAERTFTIQLELSSPVEDSLHMDSPVPTLESLFSSEATELPEAIREDKQQTNTDQVIIINLVSRSIAQPSQYLMMQDGDTQITNQKIKSSKTSKLNAINSFFWKAEQIKPRIHRKLRRVFQKRKRIVRKDKVLRFRKVGR